MMCGCCTNTPVKSTQTSQPSSSCLRSTRNAVIGAAAGATVGLAAGHRLYAQTIGAGTLNNSGQYYSGAGNRGEAEAATKKYTILTLTCAGLGAIGGLFRSFCGKKSA